MLFRSNVVVKGTIMGAISNADGTFSISVPNQNATLVFSFIGYIAKEVTLTSLQFLNVTLAEETTALDEVVVIGYGTQRKRDLTGSVAAANIQNIQNNAVSNVGNAIQGKLAGVEISPSSGDPRAGVSIKIRGQGTFGASSSPLIVIDGIITNQGRSEERRVG